MKVNHFGCKATKKNEYAKLFIQKKCKLLIIPLKTAIGERRQISIRPLHKVHHSSYSVPLMHKKIGPMMMEPILDGSNPNRLPSVVDQVVNQCRNITNGNAALLVAIGVSKINVNSFVAEQVVNNT